MMAKKYSEYKSFTWIFNKIFLFARGSVH